MTAKNISKLIKTSVIALFLGSALNSAALADDCPDLLKHMKRKLNSQEVVNMCEQYAGKTILFVNTASKCGFTPQFEGLEALYEKYKNDNFVVLGFPSNDFKQEFDDEGKTAEVCELTYGVNFPMFEPISVRGKNADPLYAKLTEEAGKPPRWNFNKYLVSADGTKVIHFGRRVTPDDKDFLSKLKEFLKQTK